MTVSTLTTPSTTTAPTTTTSSTPVDAAKAAAWAMQRLNMVDSQVRPSDVVDRRIIRAMGQVPREAFVPEGLKSIAYMDNPVPLAVGREARALMEPRLLAKLLQLADVPDGGRVLEIGTGSGYGVAVLAAMGLKATALESDPERVAAAQAALAAVGAVAANAGTSWAAPMVRTGDLKRGAPDDGPFDAIIMAGAIDEAPQALLDQLKSGGRLVAVRGVGPGGKATAWVRSGTTIAVREAFDASAGLLPGFGRAAAFAL